MSAISSIVSAALFAPFVSILSAVILSAMQRGTEYITLIATQPQKGHLRTLRPYFKNVNMFLERLLPSENVNAKGPDMKVTLLTVLLMTLIICVIALIFEQAPKTDNKVYKVVSNKKSNDKSD